MQQLKAILLDHVRKYPRMQPTDAVKLIYQNEFGGGHLIKDPRSCLSFLQQEYAATPQADVPLLEDLGNGILRVMLSGLDAHRYSVTQLGDDFLRSSASIRGSYDSFLQKLALLRTLTQEGQMPFSAGELDTYLTAYEKAGFPPVSHSDDYRQAYHPAYRVVSSDCLPRKFQKQTR